MIENYVYVSYNYSEFDENDSGDDPFCNDDADESLCWILNFTPLQN